MLSMVVEAGKQLNLPSLQLNLPFYYPIICKKCDDILEIKLVSKFNDKRTRKLQIKIASGSLHLWSYGQA